MNAFEIESFDGVRLRAYRTPPVVGRDPLALALPLATRPSYCARAIACLAERFSVITWEARLVLEPEVAIDGRAALSALSIDAQVNDAIAVLDHLGIERASLFGYCSGATTALHLAASYRHRFTRLVLASGAYFISEDQCEHTQYEHDLVALAPLVAGDRAGAGQLFEQFFAGNRRGRRDHEFASEIYRPYDNVESFYRFNVCIDNFMRADALCVAARVAVPALVASGGRDDQTHPASSAAVAAALAGGETYCDPDGDHYELCRGEPALIARVVRFLASA